MTLAHRKDRNEDRPSLSKRKTNVVNGSTVYRNILPMKHLSNVFTVVILGFTNHEWNNYYITLHHQLLSAHHLSETAFFQNLTFLKHHKKNINHVILFNPKIVKSSAKILKIGSLIK